MKQTNQSGTAARSHGRRAFTIVELLAVMLIMVIIMGIAIPAFDKLTMGSGVSASARVIGSQLRLTRQHAITQREHVALLLPTTNLADVPESAYTAFRPCIVDGGTLAFSSWIENTQWEFVPVGTVIAQVDDTGGLGTNNPAQIVTDVPDGAGTVSVRAVIFRPTGRIHGSFQQFVTLAEGSAVAGITNNANTLDIRVDQYTGRISYED